MLFCVLAAEDSSSEGWMIADKLHLPVAGSSGSNTSSTTSSSSSGGLDVVFGCENAETGEIYKQRADGVLGLGNSDNALPRQVRGQQAEHVGVSVTCEACVSVAVWLRYVPVGRGLAVCSCGWG